jgi:hypothetical protein
VLEARHRATAETVPTFIVIRSTKEAPNSVPAASRVRRSLSSWPPGPTSASRPGSSLFRWPPNRCAPRPSPYLPELSWFTFRIRTHAGSSRTPLRHPCRTHTIWQSWRVPALSGLLPPILAPPGQESAPSFTVPAATGPAAKASHLHSKHQRLVAHADSGTARPRRGPWLPVRDRWRT